MKFVGSDTFLSRTQFQHSFAQGKIPTELEMGVVFCSNICRFDGMFQCAVVIDKNKNGNDMTHRTSVPCSSVYVGVAEGDVDHEFGAAGDECFR